MRTLPALLIMLLVFLLGCKKTEATVELQPGTYSGTFQRIQAQGGAIAAVSLSFAGNTWSGQGQFSKYPALCQGSFRLSGNGIKFENGCAWTAEFDWTLILSGEYQLRVKGNNIEFSKELTPGIKDVYKLTKQ